MRGVFRVPSSCFFAALPLCFFDGREDASSTYEFRTVDRVLEKAEGAAFIGQVVIAMTVVAGEDSRRGGSDLVGACEPAACA